MCRTCQLEEVATAREAGAEVARTATAVGVAGRVDTEVVEGLPIPVYRYLNGRHLLFLPSSQHYRYCFSLVTALLMLLSERLENLVPRREPLRTELLFVLLYARMIDRTTGLVGTELNARYQLLEQVVLLERDQQEVGAIYAEELAAVMDIRTRNRRYQQCRQIAANLETAAI